MDSPFATYVLWMVVICAEQRLYEFCAILGVRERETKVFEMLLLLL